jgi:RNA polymerase sigma-70 factor (ECF subfamily)
MTFSPTTRASLLLRLRDPQDHQAWLEFVTLYEPVTYRIFRRHGLQDADAREVTQELFLAVSRSIDRWDPAKERGSFRGWLRCVARNLVVNWLNCRQRQLIVAGGPDLQSMLDKLPDDSGPETVEFD